jgi:hypothetical protein
MDNHLKLEDKIGKINEVRKLLENPGDFKGIINKGLSISALSKLLLKPCIYKRR